MTPEYTAKNNPRVIVIQKLYGKFFNDDEDLKLLIDEWSLDTLFIL